jgi:hypothetical protein
MIFIQAMTYFTDILELFSRWMREGLFGISMAIVATLLTIFGGDINKYIKSVCKKYVFPVRLIIFVLLCAVGYGLITVMAAKLLCNMLGGLNGKSLSPVVILIFITVGFIAERRNHI